MLLEGAPGFKMETTCLFLCLAALILLILITIFGFVIYSGLFATIIPGAGPPPIKNVKIAYKFGRGPYKNVGPIFTEVCSLAPKLRCVGIYYDDPKRVPSERLRWAVGTILAEGDQQPDEELVRLMCGKGFKTFGFPLVSNAVKCVFPFRSYLSVIIAIFRVYPLMGEFVKINKLCAHPYLEIYEGDILHFMAPLARQDEFYVPETYEEEEDEEEPEVEPPSTSGFSMQLRRRNKGEQVDSKSKGKNKDEHEKIKITAREEKDRETSSKPKVTDSSGKRSASEETSGAKGKSADTTTVQDSGISSTASLASSSGESTSPSPLRSGASSMTSPGGTSASDGSATLSESSVLTTTTTDASSLLMSLDTDGMSHTSLGGSEGGGGTLSGFNSESNSDDAEPFEVIRKEDAQ